MSLQTFFDNFALLTDLPRGVATLRRLILQLAFEGKLVSQSVDDEPASELLKRIRSEKRRMANEHKSKLPKNVQSPTGLNGLAIPVGWTFATLGEIAYKITDGTHRTPAYVGKGVPFISVKDFSGGHLDFSSTRFISEEEHRLLYKRCDPRRGDILLGRIGTLGKAVLVDTDDAFSLFVSVALIRFDHDFISPIFLRLLLNSPLVDREFQRIKVGGGTHTNKLNLSDLHTIVIPVPPFEEQRRIVVKVDELMRLCDEFEVRQQAKRESRMRLNNATLAPLNNAASLAPEDVEQTAARLADNFDTLYDSVETVSKLRSTILQLGVQGRLVPQEAGEAPFSVRGGSALDELEAGIFPIPPRWRLSRFEGLAEIVGGVTKGRRLDGRETACYPYLRVANVQRGFLDLDVMKEIEIPQNEIEKYRLEMHDLLITEGGDWDKVGRTAIWRNEVERCIHQNHVFRARLKYDSIIPEWIMNYMNSAAGRLYFEAASKQTTNLASINMRQLKACPILIPPLEEQRRIVAKINRLMALCDELEAKLRRVEADAEKLMNAAVQHVLEAVMEAPARAVISEMVNF